VRTLQAVITHPQPYGMAEAGAGAQSSVDANEPDGAHGWDDRPRAPS
jgi:hypothetical protein